MTTDDRSGSITWIFFDPKLKGKGLGRVIVDYLVKNLEILHNVHLVHVRTSQSAYRFFEKFGFEVTSTTKDYWAPGFDLYEMSIRIGS